MNLEEVLDLKETTQFSLFEWHEQEKKKAEKERRKHKCIMCEEKRNLKPRRYCYKCKLRMVVKYG